MLDRAHETIEKMMRAARVSRERMHIPFMPSDQIRDFLKQRERRRPRRRTAKGVQLDSKRIKESKCTFRRLSDPRGLAFHITQSYGSRPSCRCAGKKQRPAY